MIEIKNIKKTFKRRISGFKNKYEIITAVDIASCTINDGEIFGLIGPTGAGKTTTLKILSTLILPESGSVKIDGFDVIKEPDEVRKKVGYLSGEFARSLYWRLTGFENLEFFAKIRGIKNATQRINDLISILGLEDYKNEFVMNYSTGMKHKLALAVCLINNPSVILLDEPLTGIDPLTAFEIKNLIKNEFGNRTIIWASHNLYEVDEMCDRVALLNRGKIIIEGAPEFLKKNYWKHFTLLIKVDKPEVFKKILDSENEGDLIKIKTFDLKKTLEEVIEISRSENIKIFDIKTSKPSLEDIFREKIKNV